VFVLGPEDSHAKLTDIARQLSSEVAMQRLSLDNLTISYVDTVVQGKSHNCSCDILYSKILFHIHASY